MREGSLLNLSFERAGWLGQNAIRRFQETRARETEIPLAECRCGRCRSCFHRNRARRPRVATKRTGRKLASRRRAFVWSRGDKRAFPCRPKRPRRETKRRSASTTLESAAKDERQYVRRKYAEAARSRAREHQLRLAPLSMKSATACREPVGTRNAGENASQVFQ